MDQQTQVKHSHGGIGARGKWCSPCGFRGGQLINIFLLATSPCQVSRDSVTSLESQGAVLCTHRFSLRAQAKMVTFISSAPPSSWLLGFPSLSLIRWCYLAAEQGILCWVVGPASNFVSCFPAILCLPMLHPHKLSIWLPRWTLMTGAMHDAWRSCFCQSFATV